VANIGDYEQTYRSSAGRTPERFNFGRDVVDGWEDDRPAMIWLATSGEERRLSFGDFSRLSNRFANAMRNLGIERGDRVMVMLGKVPEWHAILTGLLKLGAIAIPCAPQLRAGDLKFRSEHSGSVAIISGPEGIEEAEKMRPDAPESLRHFVSLGGDHDGWGSYERLTDDASQEFDAEDTAADEGAFLLYTSGTTKHPKGVLHTHGYTHAKRMQARYWLDLQEGDRLWCTSGTGWAKSVWNVLLGPWSLGTEIFFHEGGFDPAERLDLIARYGITVLCQAPNRVPPACQNAGAGERRPEFHSARGLRRRAPQRAGHRALARAARAHHLRRVRPDGEHAARGQLPGLDVRPGSMGKPSPGCEVEILDLAGNPCPPEEPGDIALHGRAPVLFKEYWEQPDETEAVFRDGYYLTGDRAQRDEDGYLWFVGRADDVILSAGYRIGPFEVESALIEHPAVVESAVVPAPDPDRGSVVKAFVVLGAGYEPSEDLAKEIQDFCKEQTAPYKYPRKMEFVDELPKTTSGKIRRVELRQRETAGA
jgi:acetyl-CoA synthetase/medium-chain acyl-CoA synthetase